MKKVLVLLLLISSLFSKTVSSQFEVSFGVLGEVAIADATIKSNGDKYVISLVAKSTGIAKVLSGNKEEVYVSEGIVENGYFRPNLFRKKVKNNYKEDFSLYTIDYDKKEVVRQRFIQKADEDELETHQKKEDYFSNNDVLSLFFNLPNYLDELKEKKVIEKLAVGANKNDKLIKIELLVDEEREQAKELLELGDENIYLKITINQKIFASDKGELIISLGEDYYCQKAILKDVMFFGDVVGTQKYQKVIN